MARASSRRGRGGWAPFLPLWTRAPSPCKAVMGTESLKAKHYLAAVNTQGQPCLWGVLQATPSRIPAAHLMENSRSPRQHLGPAPFSIHSG